MLRNLALVKRLIVSDSRIMSKLSISNLASPKGLMEEKGIHSSDSPVDSSGSPTSGKKSLGQKIKDKLHRH